MQPPPNPYGAPDPYGQPNPYGTPKRGVSMDVIGEAWKMVQANIGPWIGAAAIYLVVAIVLNFLQCALQRPVNTADFARRSAHFHDARKYARVACGVLGQFRPHKPFGRGHHQHGNQQRSHRKSRFVENV